MKPCIIQHYLTSLILCELCLEGNLHCDFMAILLAQYSSCNWSVLLS